MHISNIIFIFVVVINQLKNIKMNNETLITKIARNCEWYKTVNDVYLPECLNRNAEHEKLLPNGSGVDSGCKINMEKSGSKKVVIDFSFHHMDENGYYTGWTDHSIVVTPELVNGFDLRITGRNKNDIKSYLLDLFHYNLQTIVD